MLGYNPGTMHLDDLLSGAAIVLGTALAVGWAARVLRAPSIVGYLITGLLLSPSVAGQRVFGALHGDEIIHLADLGLVLLLFTIGLELSPRRLLRMGPRLGLATLLQAGGTTLAAFAVVAWATSLPPLACFIIGAGVSLSSTAIVLKLLSDRGEINTAAGNISTGILLLQDVAVIVFMIALPLLAPAAPGASVFAKFTATGLGLLQLGIFAAAAHLLLPRIISAVTSRGGHEMTALLALLAAAGGAWVADNAGWSLAVGACIAGLLLAEADVKHQLIADITPFRDIFNAVFFISLGMLVDLDTAWQHAGPLTAAILLSIVGKTLITTGAVVAAGWPLRLGVQLALGLATVSEFTYVLAREASQYQLLPAEALGFLVAYAVGTMLLGALLTPLSGPLARHAMAWLQPDTARIREQETRTASELRGHVIIVGYGLAGQNLARVLTATRIPFAVIEMDRGRAAHARDGDTKVIYGDAARMPILRSAGLEHARALVVATGDPAVTRHVVAQCRAARKDLYIVARTHHVTEIDTLKNCGADVVIPAEFEVSIEIFSQVLKEFRIPDNVLRAQIASIRAGGYSVLRGVPYDRAAHLKELMEVFSTTATETYYVDDTCTAAGHTIADTALRKTTGASIIAIVRAGQPQVNPMPGEQIAPGDVLVLVGSHPQLDAARALLDGSDPTETGTSLP